MNGHVHEWFEDTNDGYWCLGCSELRPTQAELEVMRAIRRQESYKEVGREALDALADLTEKPSPDNGSSVSDQSR